MCCSCEVPESSKVEKACSKCTDFAALLKETKQSFSKLCDISDCAAKARKVIDRIARGDLTGEQCAALARAARGVSK